MSIADVTIAFFGSILGASLPRSCGYLFAVLIGNVTAAFCVAFVNHVRLNRPRGKLGLRGGNFPIADRAGL